MKKNLVSPKKEAQIWCIKNKMSLTDIIIKGIENTIK